MGEHIPIPASPSFTVMRACIHVSITQGTNNLKILEMLIETRKREIVELYVVGQSQQTNVRWPADVSMAPNLAFNTRSVIERPQW